MKNVTAILSAAAFLLFMNIAAAQTCCKKPTGMQALALNKSFKASHEAPLPLNYTPDKGSMVQFKVTDGSDGTAFYVPSDGPADKTLIIFHEWWGLNDYIRREAENWQKMLGPNVEVYAVDLYDGKAAVTTDEASKLMSDLDPQRANNIISALLYKIGKNKKIATLGWCMGGSWSFTGAVLAGDEAVGCVMYYGFPDKNPNHIKPLRCDVMYIRGNLDDFIKKNDVDDFGRKVEVVGHKFELQSFDAVHAFANPSNPRYDKKATADAQALTLRFLKEKMGIQ